MKTAQSIPSAAIALSPSQLRDRIQLLNERSEGTFATLCCLSDIRNTSTMKIFHRLPLRLARSGMSSEVARRKFKPISVCVEKGSHVGLDKGSFYI